MDEKTSALREIFVGVTDEETVTESQADTRGTLVSGPDPGERLAAVVAAMRERLDFETGLDDGALVAVVRGYYAGEDDATIARSVGADPDAVAAARLDLHLLRDADVRTPFDGGTFRSLLDDGADDETIAGRLDVEPDAVRRHRRVVSARREGRRTNRRYRDQFEALLEDSDIADRMTGDVGMDGLEGATEGQEVDVDF